MSRIERQVHVAAPPADVAAHLRHSRWSAALVLAPEGIGTRVTIEAPAEPPAVAAALEVAMLADVCRVKSMLEGGTAGTGQPDQVGKST
ncbi:MAG: hypothetical protein AAF081_12755 [Actinomycetota bacterium]